MLKFPHDDPEHRTNVPQFFIGMFSLAFTVYMIPGLWGAPLKAISAFAPPMNTQDFNLQHTAVEAKYTDYEEGMAAAARMGKPVMVDFTGFGCVNCRKMEAAVWTDAQVADILNDKYGWDSPTLRSLPFESLLFEAIINSFLPEEETRCGQNSPKNV